MCSKGESQLRKSFRQWELVRRQAKSSINTNEEIVKLKLELCNMKAQLEEISRRDQNAGYLVAERALNRYRNVSCKLHTSTDIITIIRELSRTNLELRKYIQELDEKMLELVSAPLLKKRELIHQFLMEKDDEIIELRKENDFLKASIENKEVSNDTTKKEKVYPSKGKFRSLPFDINGRENGSHFSDKAISTDASIPISSRMNKDAARKIILLEIRRLQDSHAHAAKANNLLLEEVRQNSDDVDIIASLHTSYYYHPFFQLNAEKTDNIEKALVIHTLEKRFQALQRSSVSLRELLRQREGDKGILNLIDSLNAVGAGGAALQDYWNSNNVGNPSPNQEPQYDDHTEYLSNMNTNSVMPSKNREKEPTNYSKAVDDLLYSVKR